MISKCSTPIYTRSQFMIPKEFQAYEIENICDEIKCVHAGGVVCLFQKLRVPDLKRQPGQIGLLIAMDQATIHHRYKKEKEGIVLFSSISGTNKVIGGSHHLLNASDNVNATVVASSRSRIVKSRVVPEEDYGFDGLTTEQF